MDVCACVYERVLSQSVIGKDDSLGTTDTGMTHAVVMRLIDPIKGRGHDNGFGACGTV